MSYDFQVFGPTAPDTYDEAESVYFECAEQRRSEGLAASPEITAYRDWLISRWPSLADPNRDDAARGAMSIELGPLPNMLLIYCNYGADNAWARLGIPAVEHAIQSGLSVLDRQAERLLTAASMPVGLGPGQLLS